MATPEAISGRTFASRKSTARTTRGTNKSPTKSTVAFRLGAVARIQRPYVLRCGDKWLSSEMARSLTADISQAGLSEDASAMEALGRKLSDAFHPKYWPERLQLEQLSCTVEGLVTGSGPLTDYEAPPPLDWPSSKLHNAALAETAWFEASDGGEALHAHSFMLKASAMWPLVQKQYEAELENDALESLPQHKDLALPMFAARMLYAGIVMGRRERDRRTVHGDLALDFPATPLAERDAADLAAGVR